MSLKMSLPLTLSVPRPTLVIVEPHWADFFVVVDELDEFDESDELDELDESDELDELVVLGHRGTTRTVSAHIG